MVGGLVDGGAEVVGGEVGGVVLGVGPGTVVEVGFPGAVVDVVEEGLTSVVLGIIG